MAKKRIQNLLKHVVCILLCLCVVLPFYMVLINSFKTKAEAARMSLALPTEWVLFCTLWTVFSGQLCNSGTCTQYTSPE